MVTVGKDAGGSIWISETPLPPTQEQLLCNGWFSGMSNFGGLIYLIIGFFTVLIVIGITSLIVMLVKNDGMVDNGEIGFNFKAIMGGLIVLVLIVMVLTIMIASMCAL